MRAMRLILTTSIALCLAAPVAAQTATPAPATQDAAPTLPDIEFSATVRMDALRVRSTPSARVDFHGGPRLDTRHDVERDGIPAPLRPGTYRDAGVRVTIAASVLDPRSLPDAAAAPSTPTPEKDPP